MSTALDGPVENIIVLVIFMDEEIVEKFPQIGVIGLVIKTKSMGVVQKNGKFAGESTTQEST